MVVPPLLTDQWAEELEAKFQVSRLGYERVTIVATEDIEEAWSQKKWGMVVIDEAQHVAAYAASENVDELARFAWFQRLCGNTERLLLLSATPS